MSASGKSILEILLVIAIAILFAVITSITWENEVVEKISSFLFKVFLPGIWLSMQAEGGPHSSSEINVAIGVFVQFIVMYWVLKKIFSKLFRAPPNKFIGDN